MAGIRGAKNPVPSKTKTASGLFKQSGSGTSFSGKDTKAYAHGGERIGPKTRDNRLKDSAGASHHVNQGLKRGTSNR